MARIFVAVLLSIITSISFAETELDDFEIKGIRIGMTQEEFKSKISKIDKDESNPNTDKYQSYKLNNPNFTISDGNGYGNLNFYEGKLDYFRFNFLDFYFKIQNDKSSAVNDIVEAIVKKYPNIKQNIKCKNQKMGLTPELRNKVISSTPASLAATDLFKEALLLTTVDSYSCSTENKTSKINVLHYNFKSTENDDQISITLESPEAKQHKSEILKNLHAAKKLEEKKILEQKRKQEREREIEIKKKRAEDV